MTAKRHMGARQIIVIGDTHCNSTLGLCLPDGHRLDDGGRYMPSPFQIKLWELWRNLCGDWIPRVTKGEPWDLVLNGDAIDGDHHKTPTIISRNLQDQYRVAKETLSGIVQDCRDSGGRYYHVRGTEAHVGPSAQEEERLAEALGAEPDKTGNHSRWRLRRMLGDHLVTFRHHIGGGASQAYEGTALTKTQVNQMTDAGRWGRRVAQVDVRSHRHRYAKWEKDGAQGHYITIVTPGWQGLTPFSHRMSDPQEPEFGAVLVRHGDEEIYSRSKVYSIPEDDDDVSD